MIRGPVLPQSREGSWALVANRLGAIESGLVLVESQFTCGNGQFGAVDGLARDAAGAPVLVLLAIDDDALLVARALDAVDFLRRVGGALAAAVPEARFAPEARGRVLLVAPHAVPAAANELVGRGMAGLQVCRLEAFRLGGKERFAVVWLGGAATGVDAEGTAAPEFLCPPAHAASWRTLHELCARLDPAVHVSGDRYRRRIVWQGHPLGEVMVEAGELRATAPSGFTSALANAADVRAFADQLVRGYAQAAGLTVPQRSAATSPAERSNRTQGARDAGAPESLRSAAAAAMVTPEEYCALDAATSSVADPGAATADDVARIVAAQERAWPDERTQ